MKNEIEAMITDITATTAEAEDYTGEDGLLYCGKCHTLEPAARPEPAATPGPTARPGFAATSEPAAAPASAGPGPQSGMSVPQSAAEPVTVSEAPAAAEPEEAESGAREVAVPVGAVLGEVINHDVQTLADTIAPRRDMASELRRGEPVADLRNAIGINDKFLLIRDLFGGDGEAYEEAIATDRKSTRLNSSHTDSSRMPSSA